MERSCAGEQNESHAVVVKVAPSWARGQHDLYFLQYVHFVIYLSVDACLQYHVFVFLAASEALPVPAVTWKFFQQLLSNALFKQTRFFFNHTVLFIEECVYTKHEV